VEGSEANGNGELSEVNAKRTAYDGRKRNPEYSNAERSCLWELVSPTSAEHGLGISLT